MNDQSGGFGTEWMDPVERDETVEGLVLRKRHEAAYTYAREYSTGVPVVDLGCGVGYGARLLGGRPTMYVGVDRSAQALRTASSRTAEHTAHFACADLTGNVPLRSGFAGLVLAFQVIEHIPTSKTDRFLSELGRLCRPGGYVILTTPNRRHRLLPFQQPWNPYHVREFRQKKLARLLRGFWSEVSMMGLRADEQIETIELARVRQDPKEVYSRPLRRILPDRMKSWIGDVLPSRNRDDGNAAEAASLPVEQVTTERFRVEDDPEGEGLDLVAVCRA